MSDNNVVVFPKTKRNTPPQSLEEIKKNREDITKEHVEYLLEDIVGMIVALSYDAGFNLSDDEVIKSTILISESIKAALYRSKGIDHPLHTFSDNVDVSNITSTHVDVSPVEGSEKED